MAIKLKLEFILDSILKKKEVFYLPLTTLLFALFLSINVNAQTTIQAGTKFGLESTISLFVGSEKAYFNDKVVKIDESNDDVVPFVVNGRTLLPIRFVSEKLGAKIEVDKAVTKIKVTLGNCVTIITPGSNHMEVNGEVVELDIPAINKNGRVFLPLRKFVEETLNRNVFYYKGLIIICDNEGTLNIDTDKAVISDLIELLAPELFLVKKDKRYGYIDRFGKMVIPLKYEKADYFSEGLASIKVNGKYGYIDKLGEIAIAADLYYASSFTNGYAEVIKDRNQPNIISIINKNGDAIVQAYNVNPTIKTVFSEGLCAVGFQNRKIGYINEAGETIIPPSFDEAYDFHEGYAQVCINKKYGFIDKSGQFLVEPQFDMVGDFSEGFATVCKGGKFGYVDSKGKLAIDLIYDYAFSFKEDRAMIRLDDKCGFLDRSGKIVIDAKFQSSFHFFEGLTGVQVNDKWGVIDKNGKFIISPKYEFEEYMIRFEDGIAKILTVKDGNYGCFFIDKSDNVVIPFIKGDVNDFKNGLAEVIEYDDDLREISRGYINKSGQFVWKESQID